MDDLKSQIQELEQQLLNEKTASKSAIISLKNKLQNAISSNSAMSDEISKLQERDLERAALEEFHRIELQKIKEVNAALKKEIRLLEDVPLLTPTKTRFFKKENEESAHLEEIQLLKKELALTQAALEELRQKEPGTAAAYSLMENNRASVNFSAPLQKTTLGIEMAADSEKSSDQSAQATDEEDERSVGEECEQKKAGSLDNKDSHREESAQKEGGSLDNKDSHREESAQEVESSLENANSYSPNQKNAIKNSTGKPLNTISEENGVLEQLEKFCQECLDRIKKTDLVHLNREINKAFDTDQVVKLSNKQLENIQREIRSYFSNLSGKHACEPVCKILDEICEQRMINNQYALLYVNQVTEKSESRKMTVDTCISVSPPATSPTEEMRRLFKDLTKAIRGVAE